MRHDDIAAYIWPSYHYELRLEHFWPEKTGKGRRVSKASVIPPRLVVWGRSLRLAG